MPFKKEQFIINRNNLYESIDVDDSRGREIPNNMNFVESGYLSKDTGSTLFGATETDACHSLYYYKKKDGVSYFIRAKNTKLQVYNYKRVMTADAATNVFTSNAHGMSDGTTVYVQTGGVLPSGLTTSTVYYVISSTTNTFKLSLTNGGTEIDITTAGTGNQYFYKVTPVWEDLSPTYTAGYEFGFIVYDDILYGSNGKEDYFKWDGTTFTTYASAPKGNVLEIFEDRMYVAGVLAEPLTIYYSDIGDPTTFDPSSVLKPVGTDSVIGLENYYGFLLIFKKDTIWKLSFQYDATVNLFLPKLELQSGNYGACSRSAISWVENDIWFFTGREVRSIGFKDQQTGVLGVNASVISDQIKETLFTIPTANYSQVSTYYHNRRFYLNVSMTSGVGNNTTFVCHLLHKNLWTKYTSRIKSQNRQIIEVDNVLYSAKSITPFGVLRWDDSVTTDNGTAISSYVQFTKIEDDDFNRFNLYRYLDLMFKNLNGTVGVTIKEDANDVRATKSTTFYVGNVLEDELGSLGDTDWGEVLFADSYGQSVESSPFIKKRISMLSKDQTLTIKLSESTSTGSFTIAEFSLTGSKHPRRMFKPSSILSI